MKGRLLRRTKFSREAPSPRERAFALAVGTQPVHARLAFRTTPLHVPLRLPPVQYMPPPDVSSFACPHCACVYR